MSTIRDLITDAFIEAGILAANQSLSASDAQFGLRKLNRLLDTWAADGFVITGPYREYIDITQGMSSPGSYGTSIGTGLTIDTETPLRILSAAILIDGLRYPLEVITAQEFSQIADSEMTGRPTKIWLQNKNPSSKVYFWPRSDAAYSMEMISEKSMSGYGLDDTFSLAPGYERLFVSNLALDICPSYGVEPSALLVKAAQDSYSACARLVFEPSKMESDFHSVKRFNIYTGDYET
jgi:hypothetical protein